MKSQRHQQILSMLVEAGQQAVVEMSATLGVSEMTLRRDLEELEGKGLLRRVHGGAVLASETDPGYWLRHRQSQLEKRELGQLAATQVESGMSVFIDTGTTAVEVARALAARGMKEGLRAAVATHSLSVALELTSAPSISIHMIGGSVSSDTLGTFGPHAVSEIARLRLDLAFIGVTGVDLEAGFTNTSAIGIEVKQALLRRARIKWVVADASKWGKASLLPVCNFNEVDGWITDARLGASNRGKAQKAGLRVLVNHRA